MKKLPPPLSPAGEKHFFNELILKNLLLGESLTICFIPHGGKKTLMKYFSRKSRRPAFLKLGKSLCCFIDHDELARESPAYFFRLILNCLEEKKVVILKKTKLKSKKRNPLTTLKETLEKLVKAEYHLILIINKLDELKMPAVFFNNLKRLWEIDKTRLHFIFTVTTPASFLRKQQKYGQLREVICQNIIFFPLLDLQESRHVLTRICRRYHYQLSAEKKKIIFELAGGHPYLLKSLARIFNKNPLQAGSKENSLFLKEAEIQMILEDLWQNLTKKEKQALRGLTNKAPLSRQDIPQRLLNFNLVIFKNKKAVIFSPLFSQFIKNKKSKLNLISFDDRKHQILINNLPTPIKFTLQEIQLLALFTRKPLIVHSRDTVAQSLWGKEYYDKYSDWAIDQAISNLRKKLARLGIAASLIQTIRGRGYRWLG
ncbi:MAG: winged helix-turn-helix transcriptional regulator [Candidatus Pacebacteria bacterium]|nr:winged helix-turn-helix transcriptional regulator [Candidatus Paceibacterota bacterium]